MESSMLERERFIRTEMLFGAEAMERLASSRVIVFGIGGVGGYVVEALVRSGIGAIDLVDHDVIALSNLNRQIIATTATIGRFKVDVMQERAAQINPECRVRAHRCFYLPETQEQFVFSEYDYIVDAIDTVTGKIQLACRAREAKTPIISCMGTGNKKKPAQFEVADIYQTSVCPLARVMRRELKRRGIEELKVVYSREKPCVPQAVCGAGDIDNTRRAVPASNAFVPAAAGLLIASEVVKDLL